MKVYIQKWSYKRVIQLTVGIYFLYGFYDDGSFFFLLLGLLMSAQAILNIGCFSTKGCNNTVDNDLEIPVSKKIKRMK